MPAAPPIPVARPALPPARALLPYLRQIDANAWYSNHGPLARAFQARLAAHWDVEAAEVALLCNATSALTVALLASGAPRGSRCLLPSWTFAATAGAVQAAGLVPHFVDVCPQRWTPAPETVRHLAAQPGVGAVIVVSPFGAPLGLSEWEDVQAATGVPVVIDAAAAFDTLRSGGPMRAGACPMVVSLHATKVFGVGEGGALLCRDAAIMEKVRRLAQFGFLGTREAVLPGINAKMSEYAAAVGLAGLDAWPEARARWAIAASSYARRLDGSGGLAFSPGFGAGWVASTLSVLCPGDAAPAAAALAAAGIGTLRWWGDGCHAQPAFRECPAEPLPNTRDLARRTLGLPFFQALTERQVDAVYGALLRHVRPVPAPAVLEAV